MIIQKKRNVKYLGVYLDNNLTWKPHIEYLCTKLSAASYVLIKLRYYVDLKTLIAVYNSIVYLQGDSVKCAQILFLVLCTCISSIILSMYFMYFVHY